MLAHWTLEKFHIQCFKYLRWQKVAVSRLTTVILV